MAGSMIDSPPCASAAVPLCEACAQASVDNPCALHQQELFYVPHAATAESLFSFLGDEGEMLISDSECQATGSDMNGTSFAWETSSLASCSTSNTKQVDEASSEDLNLDTTESEHDEFEEEQKRGAASPCYDDNEKEDDDDDDESNKKRKLTSKYLGVCWYKRTKKWVCQIKIDGKRKHLGYFANEDEAGETYNKALHAILEFQDARAATNGGPKARKRTFNTCATDVFNTK